MKVALSFTELFMLPTKITNKIYRHVHFLNNVDLHMLQTV